MIPLMVTGKVKTDENGNIAKFKCRCTVRGDKQIPHVHFDPTQISSAVASKDAICVGLSLAAEKGWYAEHIDIESAFLHEILEDTKPVYVKQLPRLNGQHKYPNCVGILQGNIYDTKSACRIFTSGLASNLELINFTRSSADACTFTLKETNTNNIIILIITVDDFLTITNKPTLLENIKKELRKKYTLKDLGPVKHILGWKVERNWAKPTIKISQPAYIEHIAKTYNRTYFKPTHTPYSTKLPEPNPNDHCIDRKLFPLQSLIGHLRYVADSTRPEISNITGYLGRFVERPIKTLWDSAIKVVKYLYTTKSSSITYERSGQMQAYSDSDYANCPQTLRSTTGYVVTMNGGPISWQSKRQRRTAGSTWEAEYMAAYQTTRQVCVLRQLLRDMDQPPKQPTNLYIDNSAALTTSITPYPTSKSKQTKVEFQVIKDKVQAKEIKPLKVRGTNNSADCFKKHHSKAQHQKCRELLGIT